MLSGQVLPRKHGIDAITAIIIILLAVNETEDFYAWRTASASSHHQTAAAAAVDGVAWRTAPVPLLHCETTEFII